VHVVRSSVDVATVARKAREDAAAVARTMHSHRGSALSDVLLQKPMRPIGEIVHEPASCPAPAAVAASRDSNDLFNGLVVGSLPHITPLGPRDLFMDMTLGLDVAPEPLPSERTGPGASSSSSSPSSSASSAPVPAPVAPGPPCLQWPAWIESLASILLRDPAVAAAGPPPPSAVWHAADSVARIICGGIDGASVGARAAPLARAPLTQAQTPTAPVVPPTVATAQGGKHGQPPSDERQKRRIVPVLVSTDPAPRERAGNADPFDEGGVWAAEAREYSGDTLEEAVEVDELGREVAPEDSTNDEDDGTRDGRARRLTTRQQRHLARAPQAEAVDGSLPADNSVWSNDARGFFARRPRNPLQEAEPHPSGILRQVLQSVGELQPAPQDLDSTTRTTVRNGVTQVGFGAASSASRASFAGSAASPSCSANQLARTSPTNSHTQHDS
jgi:hypothetical protein